jgi:hypothetical protein
MFPAFRTEIAGNSGLLFSMLKPRDRLQQSLNNDHMNRDSILPIVL